MSQNHAHQGRAFKTKDRGTKRNASDLLPTSDEDINNPRAAKRQRISNDRYEATLEAILTMSVSEINSLPEALRKQAIALRSERNICNQSNNRNNNTSNHRNNTNNYNNAPMPPKPHITQHQTLMELSNDEETDDDDDEDDGEPQQQLQHTHSAVNTQRIHQNHQQHQPQVHNIPNPTYNPSHNPLYVRPSNVVTAPSTTDRAPIIPSSQIPLRYDRTQTVLNTSPPNASDIHVPRYYNAQHLIIEDKTTKTTKYSCIYTCLYIVLCGIFLAPFVMAIPISNGFGTNYCDTNARVIRAYNDYNCIECPSNAKYCIKGRVFCDDLSYIVDTQVNECVKRSYSKQVINAYKEISNKCVMFVMKCRNVTMNYYYFEMNKWQSVKEWKEWFQKLKNISFVQFCTLYEMEVMVTFFVFTWYLPIFRCFIIFLWTRMILPTLDGDDDKLIIIYLKLLSYFAPILFGYEIWNKIAALFT